MHHSVQENEKSSSLDTQKKIERASFLLMGSILISRIIGFFREWILATTIGATPMTDVYYASFTVPDFLNYLVAAGALSISFIPILSEYLAAGKAELGKIVFRAVASVMGAVLILLIIIFEIYSEQLARIIAPGFSREQLRALSTLLRIIIPGQFFFYWGGLAISVQYAHGRFFFPAIAPILYNLSVIFFGVLFHKQLGVMGFSIGVLVGAIISHGVVQWWGIRSLGYSALPYFRFSPEINKAIRKYFWLSLPIMLGFSLVVTDEWISKYFASSMENRAVSWLSYARTEMRIPVAVIGQAAGVASFPYLARLWSEKSFEAYGRTLLVEIQKLWVLAPLATILLFDHALPITHFLFGGGAFTNEDLLATSSALQMFSAGVLFWILQVVFARGFYACQNTWIPSLIGTAITIASIPLYNFLGERMGYRGLALSGSIGIGVYCALLWVLLRLHLKKYCPMLPLSNFYGFCFAWAVVLGVAYAMSHSVLQLGLYQQTRFSGLYDVAVACIVVLTFGWISIRTVMVRFTGKPLF